MHRDACGCSRAADLADRALAEANGLNDALPFDYVSSRYGLGKTRARMDTVIERVHVVDSTYGMEAACLPFPAWFDYTDAQQEIRDHTIDLDREDQVVLYFPLITDRAVTEHDVLVAMADKLYSIVNMPLSVKLGFVKAVVAPPRREDPKPILVSQRDGRMHASAVVTLWLETATWASALEAGPLCVADDVRAQLASASTAAVPVHTLVDVLYLANIDGFQALSKASSAGTGEFQMETTFAIKLLTYANSKSTHFVLPICLFPGDDNHRNWQHVMQVARGPPARLSSLVCCRLPSVCPAVMC